ncbi:MAG: 4-hydroxythreonine-4-phosphate dehydrogenase PdxA [Deltaproteobacteria bacterium]|nr:4-hydroxythreonine-4-phosphate dehydrogenase PdxA [Deltaproteobacteria bacterium]
MKAPRKRKPTCVVIGDAAGIGPEITVKALFDSSLYHASHPILIGDPEVVEQALRITKINMEVRPISSLSEARIQYPVLNIFDLGTPKLQGISMGKISSISGQAFVRWFQKAIEMTDTGELGAIVYAPLNKEAIHAAGYPFRDEVDMIDAFTSAPTPYLLVVSIAGRYRSASIPPLHISLRQACECINTETIFNSIILLHEGLKRFGIDNPVIGVVGLNPHGGESGLHGDEEIRFIQPAVQAAWQKGIEARGPFPPDTVFVKAKAGEFDCVLGMYHDQTRIAMKLLRFKKIIYTTLGTSLNFVSVAHGTAYDIAGKGIADPDNFKQALRYGARVR